jgi:hypothetical protein
MIRDALPHLALAAAACVDVALVIAVFVLTRTERVPAMDSRQFTEQSPGTWPEEGPIVSELARRHAAIAAGADRAWMRLVYVMPPVMRSDVLAEVEHRRSLMGEVQAILSVRDDLATGRWQP